MKLSFKALLPKNSMFISLMASFLIIILISSVFCILTFMFSMNNIEDEIIRSSNHTVDYTADKLDEQFYQIKSVLLKLYFEKEFSPLLNNKPITPYIQKQIVDKFKEYRMSHEYALEYVKTIFVLPEDSKGNIITSESTFISKSYFNVFYNSSEYTRDFWLKETDKKYSINIYPSSMYFDYSTYTEKNGKSQLLLPIALKNMSNSRFLTVALIDMKGLINSIDKYDVNSLYIYSRNRELIYPLECDIDTAIKDFEVIPPFSKMKNGYLFSRNSKDKDLVYYTFLSSSTLNKQLNNTNLIFRLIILVSFLTSIIISLYIVKKFNNPVKQIVELLRKSQKQADNEVVNLNYVKDNIERIVSQNELYIKDIDSKNSTLQKFLYNATIKDLYSNIKSQLDINGSYLLIYFKLHYKKAFLEQKLVVPSKATYFLSELIQLYLNDYFNSSFTLQVENAEIISVINTTAEIDELKAIVGDIAKKLGSEEDFVFFTIVVSNIYTDVSDISKAYQKIAGRAEYRKLTSDTQILFEDNLVICDRYYLQVEQIEQLANLLGNTQKEKSMEFVDDILGYNYKKGVNSFYIFQLCSEIVNCCIKVLIKLYYQIPKDIDVTGIYSSFRLCADIEEYKRLCKDFIANINDYIKSHRKEGDYIVDYIISYIDQHYSEDLYIELLSEKLNLTSNYVSSYFKDKFGITLNDYINNYRIRKAKELLEDTNLKIKDISISIGITNVDRFIRLFKKYFGKTPAEYRKDIIHITK